MLTVPIIDKDRAEAAQIRRRKLFEEERKKRIFDGQQRMFGVDLEALERQIADKKVARDLAINCQNHYDEDKFMQDKLTHTYKLDQDLRRRINATDINLYRCRFQRKEDRREFDLNDPNALRNTQPTRVSDEDPHLGVSSAQIFVGEDLSSSLRRQQQRVQQRAWLDQQVLEHSRAKDANQQVKETIASVVYSREKQLDSLAREQCTIDRQKLDDCAEYNRELARLKRIERERERKANCEDSLAEVYNMLSSDFLNENPEVAQSPLYPNRKVAYMYRGMTPEETRTFRIDQYKQVVGARKNRQQQYLLDKQWEQYSENLDHEITIKEMYQDRLNKAEYKKLIQFNLELAEEQRKQRQRNDSLLNTNEISPAFYDQFNTTSR